MAIPGKKSQVKLGANVVAELSEASMTINGELLDPTSFDSDGWREKLAGIRDANISISGFYKPDDADGQAALREAVLAGTKISDFTYLADKDVATSGFKCDAYVASFEANSTVGGLVTLSVSLESDGEIAVSS